MPLTAEQVTAFFENAVQMRLSNRTQVHLQGEGILLPYDLINFAGKGSWDQIVENCKRPIRVPAVNNATLVVQQEAFQLPAKSLMRLNMATKAVEYYVKTDRPLTTPGLLYDQRLKNVRTEYASL